MDEIKTVKTAARASTMNWWGAASSYDLFGEGKSLDFPQTKTHVNR